jgi:allantoinase
VAEVEAIQRAIILAEETGCSLHIVHVSNSRGTELVRRSAAHFGANVTCETCPHYLVLNRRDLMDLGATAKCAPPLRYPGDNDELWQDLVDGKILFIASDHSPAPASMKTGDDVFAIWGGIAGVQSTFPILLSRGPALSHTLIAQVTATHADERFGIQNKGRIEIGYDADFALIDVAACYELKREHLHDRHKLSPYVGRVFHGLVRQTILRGTTIFRDGRVTLEPHGRLITPRSDQHA